MRMMVVGTLLWAANTAAHAEVKIGKPLPAAEATLDVIKLDGGRADFKTIRRVVIPFFQVEV